MSFFLSSSNFISRPILLEDQRKTCDIDNPNGGIDGDLGSSTKDTVDLDLYERL